MTGALLRPILVVLVCRSDHVTVAIILTKIYRL